MRSEDKHRSDAKISILRIEMPENTTRLKQRVEEGVALNMYGPAVIEQESRCKLQRTSTFTRERMGTTS